MLKFDSFLMIASAGFLATYVHMMFALWADRYGLVRLDFPHGISMLSFGKAFDGHPPYWLGLVAVHLNGIVFALLYATVVGAHLPGPPIVRGLIWGGILWIGSQCVFNPFITHHGFFARKLHPRAWQTAVLVHAIYGGVLGWLSPIV